MAKNDKKKHQAQIDTQGTLAQNQLNNLRTDTLIPQQQAAFNQYQSAIPQAQADYNDIMNRYRSFSADPANQQMTPQNLAYNRTSELDAALKGYQGFADTGGFSGEDLMNMRARGISPIRAVYANAMNEMGRQKNLAGGYSPNFNAATAKMTGGLSQQIADRTQDVNAQLAQMVQQGKLSGLGGLSQTAIADSEMANRMAMANADNALRAGQFNYSQGPGGQNLAALSGMSNLFGTTPGMANMFGQQVLGTTGQRLQGENQQQDIMNSLINAQAQNQAMPSNFQIAVGRVKKGAELAGRGVAAGMTGGLSEAALMAARGGEFRL